MEGMLSKRDRSRTSTLRARALCVCALLALSSFSHAVPAHDSSPPYVISKNVNLVVVPVVVTDKNGRFVSGLNSSNFKIYENGRQQQISLFRDEDVPVTAGVLVASSGSKTASGPTGEEGSKAFVQVSNPQDREFVVNFTETIA